MLLIAAFAASMHGPTADEGYDGGYIVKLAAPDAGLRALSADRGLYWCADLADVEALTARGLVEYAEPDSAVTLAGQVDDKYFGDQWNLTAIGIQAAWDAGFDGLGVRVAIVDSGLNQEHEDLVGVSVAKGYNVLTNSSDTTDYVGHGSFVAGIIAAKVNNGVGIAGIADGVTLVPVKCFSRLGTTSTSYVITAIYAAVDELDCDIINLSLGMNFDMRALREAIRYAVDRGVIIVSAAGNEGNEELLYPATYDLVIGVGSVGQSGRISEFSERNRSVVAVAPGEEILSISHSDSNYVTGSGTSYAAPHVTAMAAMAKSALPEVDSARFKRLLIASLSDRGPTGYDTSYGYGMVDMAAFVEILRAEQALAGSAAYDFIDIVGHWGRGSIRYCVDAGLFTGTTETTFDPNLPMNRAMLVAVLYRLSGDTAAARGEGSAAPYSDVAAGAWYEEAVRWASETGVVAGFDDGTFRPQDSLTREQTAAILWRYAGAPAPEAADYEKLAALAGADGISAWARDAMAWAVGCGLLQGGGTGVAPRDGATRAQIATMLQRFSVG